MKKQLSPAIARLSPVVAAVATLCALGAAPAHASSHREAPSITKTPQVDGTDFYMFNSYEGVSATGTGGRAGFVTMIANYLPLQDAYGGPNYFKLDPAALYEIHIDNVGDGQEHMTFQFQFNNTLKAKTLAIGTGANAANVAIPLTQFGQVTGPASANLNVNETFQVTLVRGDRRTGTRSGATAGLLTNAVTGNNVFAKPVDNIGLKTIPDYAGYAAQHIYTVNIPGCTVPGKLFVGQRKDPFAVNLGVIFDLINVPGAADFSPAEANFLLDPAMKDAGADSLQTKNVTSLALEVSASCLTAGSEKVIGGWTTASLRQGQLLSNAPKSGYGTAAINGGAWTQVSRLGHPLINEVIIGLPDKDKFNGSKPINDKTNFATYVTNPTLPALVEIALGKPAGSLAPSNIPRTDLVTTFLTGIPGVTQPNLFVTAPTTTPPTEMLRLNTGIAPVPYASQNRLGLLGGLLAGGTDLAGYPNGRRPNDDIVDISLVAAMGGLCQANGDANTYKLGAACKPSAVPLGGLVFNLHDGVDQAGAKVRAAGPLLPGFPYVGTPLPGAQ